MKTIIAITSLCALLALPAFAQTEKNDDAAQENTAQEEATEEAPSAEDVDAAMKAINSFVEDKKQVEGYCAILKEMEGLKDGDDQKAEELGQKMDTYISGLSEDIQEAFGVAEVVESESEESAKIDEAFGKLEEKCGS